MVYFIACIIAGLRLALGRQVNVRVVPTGQAIEESVHLAHEIYNRVFRKVPEQVKSSMLANRTRVEITLSGCSTSLTISASTL
jgi:hypothetical protein